jgi:SAM-dependent methyltransferase
MHEVLTRGQHLHFGYFESPTDTLALAQDRLVVRAARHLPRAALVADVGCGLGGSVNLLAAMGHRVYGLDPCAASIAYARTRTNSPRAQLLVADLTQFTARAKGARFDALFLTEVLAHFTDLPQLLGQCRSLLRPGGLVIVHDLARVGRAGPAGVHARGAFRLAADAAGFDPVDGRDLSNRVVPTLPRLTRALGERRTELENTLARSRSDFARECDEYHSELRGLELAFARQELVYESHVLCCSTRMGNDSVVLRVTPRAANPQAGAAGSTAHGTPRTTLARAEHLPRVD